jgi:Domain of unknown function (DUF4158)
LWCWWGGRKGSVCLGLEINTRGAARTPGCGVKRGVWWPRSITPRFKRSISGRELRQAYSPSLGEMEWARDLTNSGDHLLSLVVWLKCCQRLGYFPKLTEIPVQVIGHVRDELGLHEDTQVTMVADRTLRHHKACDEDRNTILSRG